MKNKIEQSNVREIFELSMVQKGMLFHHLNEAGDNLYNVQLSFVIEGELDIELLKQAIRAVQENNEVLRSVFSWDKVSKPLQVMLKECFVPLTCYELSAGSVEEADKLVQEYLLHDRTERFDLTGLPLRLTLIKKGESSYVFSITHHHILYDGWSTGIFLEELFGGYRQLKQQGRIGFGAKPTYKEVFQALQKRAGGEGVTPYWKGYLEEYEVQPFFGANRKGTVNGQIETLVVKMPIEKLDGFSRQYHVTKAAIVYSAFGLLLQKYLNTQDIVFGTTVSDREAGIAGMEEVMGNFINTIPLRLKADGNTTLLEVVNQVGKDLAGRNDYNHTSYAEIKDILKLKPGEDLFDTLVVVENYPLNEELINSNDDFRIHLDTVYEHTSLPLVVTVFFKEVLEIGFAWKPTVADKVLMGAMATHFGRLIELITEEPESTLASMAILSAGETNELVKGYNSTQRNYNKKETIVGLFEKQVIKTPDHIALEYGEVRLSYYELEGNANRIATYLREVKGVQPGDLVGLLLERDEHLVPVILGILKAGAAYVPIDPGYPTERINLIIEDGGVKLLVSRKRLLAAPEVMGTGMVDLDECLGDIYSHESKKQVEGAGPKDLAYVIYTSGSTGKPKGVMIEHRSLVNYITWAAASYLDGEPAAFPLFTSISFDLTVTSIFTPLITGNKIVVFDDNEKNTVIEKVLGHKEVNVIKLTPSHLKVVRESNRVAPTGKEQFKTFIVGGEDFPAQLAKDIYEKFNGRVKLYNEYGPTEATVGCMIEQFDPAESAAAVPIGVPADNVQIYLLDGYLKPAPRGGIGEIYISGDGLAKGYLGQKELTQQKFIGHPFLKGKRLYKTGDLGCWLPSGKLTYLGRVDEQVKIRGFRIELADIERQLRQYAGMEEVVVVVNEKMGEKYLVAYYVARQEMNAGALKSFMQEKLPAYMVPAWFVYLDQLPLTPNGKLDKKGLPEPSLSTTGERVAARDETEEKLLKIWAGILGHDQISIHSNFFDIGGDSLKLITVSSKIRTVLGKDVAVTDLTYYPTIAGLARFINPEPSPVQEVAMAPVNETGKEASTVEVTGIAVIGMAARLPGSANVGAFWQNLQLGKELITRKENKSGDGLIKAKAHLEGYDVFDASFFDYTPADAGVMDPQIRLFHACVWEALENAGYDPHRYQGAIGLYGGATANPYYNINVATTNGVDLLEEWAGLTYSDKDFLCPRVSYKLNLKGPSLNVFTACSTSLVAIDTACNELLANKCDIAVAGGVSVTLHDNEGYVYRPGMVMSPDGHCRAFDEQAAGTVGGNGVGIVVLKKLAAALRDGDHIHAVIKGTATNNDGNQKVGFAAPGVEGQSKVIAQALRNAGVGADTISYIETHGSGTLLGDPIELTALTKAFNSTRKQFCAIGSVKTNIGHLDAAAGVAAFIKTVLALQNKQLPASLNYHKPNPNIDFSNSPFYVNTALRHWENGLHPRRAGVSSFGIGGTNVHVILEEAPVLAPTSGSRDYQLLLVSAKTPASLTGNIKRLADHLTTNEETNLADIAYTLQTGRGHFPYRKMVVCKDHGEGLALLEAPGKMVAPLEGEHAPRIVFMFSGQGSQYIDMCYGLYQQEALFRTTVDQCLGMVKGMTGKDLKPVLFSGNGVGADRRIDETEYTQPALFIVEYALAKLLIHWGIRPDRMIGHSFGEYVAACISGVFSLQDALFLVVKRGELMQKAPKGVTLAIAIGESELIKVLDGYKGVSIATVNSAELCVVAGDEEDVYQLQGDMEKKGISYSVVSEGHAFHSHKMDGIKAAFEQYVQQVTIHPQQVPFISNLTGKLATDEDIRTPGYWSRHLRETVHFAAGIETLMENKQVVFVEVGPGIELCTFVRANRGRGKGHKVVNMVRHPEKNGADQYHLLMGLGKLWQQGIVVDWESFYAREARRRTPLPGYAFDEKKFTTKKVVIPPVAARADDRLVRIQDISKWFYMPGWKMAPPPVVSHPANGLIVLLLADEDGISASLSRQFGQQEIQVVHVGAGTQFKEESIHKYTVNPSSGSDWLKLFERLATHQLIPGHIIHAWGIGKKREGLDSYFYSLVELLAAAQAHGGIGGKQITFLTSDLQLIRGGEEVMAEKALALGLIKVIGQEYPSVSTNHIDISLADEWNEAGIGRLYEEVREGSPGKTVGLRNNKRWLACYDGIGSEKEESRRTVNYRVGGVYFITGGLGNVGYHLSAHLLKKYQARIVLAGRSVLPPREDWDSYLKNEGIAASVKDKITRLKELEQMGGEVMYSCCDASDKLGMAAAIKEAEHRFGPLHGVIHGAGIINGSSINPLSVLQRADYEYQFAPKITGLQVLREVTEGKALDFCMVLSSLSPILGGLEFGAYASANVYMDHYITYGREQGQLSNWLCANVDGFNLTGGAGEGINEKEIGEVFERLLSVIHLPQVVVSVADINKRIDQWVKKIVPASDIREDTAGDGLVEWEEEAANSGLTNTQLRLRRVWQHFFGIAGIDLEDDFFELGGDSLKALTLMGRLHKEFNVELSVKQLFNHSTIGKLAGYLESLSSGSGAMASGESFASIPVAPVRTSYPLSPVQRRLYFLYEFDKQSIAYNQALMLQLTGEVDKDRLKEVFGQLIGRHESLRTCFEMIDDEPRQRILEDYDFDIALFTARGDEGRIMEAFIQPFDLGKGPLIRVGLIDLVPGEYILMVDMHHIITDAVSKSVLIKDFMGLYNQALLPALPLQYKDYVEWLQGERQQEEVIKRKQFWVDAFGDALPATELPIDFARPAVKSYEGNALQFSLSTEETALLAKLAEKEGVTLFMLLLAAYAVLLSKLANQEDVVIGTITAGRQHPDVEQIIGMFVNTIPIRNYPKGEGRFNDFLKEVKSTILQCFDNQSFPYEELIDALKLERDASRNPLFDALFSFRNYEQSVLEIPGLSIRPYYGAQVVSNFDLTLTAIKRNEVIELEFEYCTRLFKAETIERFSGYFKKIITAITGNGGMRIGDIDLLSEKEKEELLVGFNNTKQSYSNQETIVGLFEQQVLRTPHKVAVVYEDQHLTYQELNEQSNRLAHYLRERYQVQPDDVIGIMTTRSARMMVGLLGILKSGAAYLPVDPTYPAKRIEYILENSGADILLVNKTLDAGIAYTGEVLALESEGIYAADRSNPVPINSSNDLCYLIYTSGSTGLPKGVMIAHYNVINFFAGMSGQLPVREDDCMLAVTSTSFDISVLELFWTLCNGIQVVIHPSDISLTSLDRYLTREEAAMDFSLFFFSSYNNQDEDKYKLLLESVKYADQEGFKAVWTPERHFHEFGGLYPNPSVLSAALAMVTKQIQLRSGSVVSPLHDAVRIAEEWAVVDNLSNGRTGLSFASGWNPNDFVLSIESYQQRHATMYRQIEEVRRLWRGESITRKNGFGKEVELKVFPAPVQKELPVWITSGGSEETFIKAGAVGAHLLTHLLGQDIEELAGKIRLYRQSLRQHGFNEKDGKVAIMLHTYIGEDIREVEKTVEQPFIDYLKSSIGLSKILNEETGLREEEIAEKDKETIINNAFKRYYKTGSLIGTRSSCSEMVRKLQGIGVDEIACLVDFGIAQDKVMEGLQLLNGLKASFKQGARVHNPITMMQSTPSFIRLAREGAGSYGFIQSLRLLLVGGEPAPLALIRQLQQDCRASIFNMYGPTETTVWSCVHRFENGLQKISVGKPIANTQLYILNRELELVPAGVAGDLYIGGEGLSRGYWKRPELTAERFIQHPFRKGERIYKTGDVAKWLSNGTVELLGREDHQVKIRGYRIELGEIEGCLLGFEAIREAVVIAKEEKEGGKYLVAYLVSDSMIDFTALREYLGRSLPQYMIPGHFVKLPALPLTPNGKVDRKALPDPVIEAGNEYTGASTETEERLVEIWSDILKLHKEVISVRSSFFELGGHSLNAILLVRKILREFEVEILLQKIFMANTIEQLAEIIDNERWVKKATHSDMARSEEIILD